MVDKADVARVLREEAATGTRQAVTLLRASGVSRALRAEAHAVAVRALAALGAEQAPRRAPAEALALRLLQAAACSQLAVGNYASVCVTADGALQQTRREGQPAVEVVGPEGVRFLAVSYTTMHAVGLSTEGEVFSWSPNNNNADADLSLIHI